MKTIKALAIAALASCTFIAAAPAVSAQQSPAMIMSRTVCFDEIKAFEAAHANTGGEASDAAATVDELIKQYVPAGDDRAYTLRDAGLLTSTAGSPFKLARIALRLCAATVGVAADGGMRDLDAFKTHWASERAKFKLAAPADPSAAAASPTRTPQMGAARTVCNSLLLAFVNARVSEGAARTDAIRYADLLIESYADKNSDRDRLLSEVATQAKAPGLSASDRAELAASACIAVVGTAVDAGMMESSELRSYWDARRKNLLPPPPPVETAAAVDCVTYDYGTGKRGEPALLRNKCDYAVTTGFCTMKPTAGSKSQEISCEKGLYTTYQIKPNHAAMVVLTDSERVSWRACRPPFRPRMWWESTDAASPSKGICEK